MEGYEQNGVQVRSELVVDKGIWRLREVGLRQLDLNGYTFSKDGIGGSTTYRSLHDLADVIATMLALLNEEQKD